MILKRLSGYAFPALLILMATGSNPLAHAAAADNQPRLLAGPMPGYSAMRATTIWLQGNRTSRVILEYWPEQQPEQIRRTTPQTLTTEQQYAAHIDITDLQPGTRYLYRVLLDDEPQAFPLEPGFQTQPLWQWRSEPPAIRLLAGSCAYINDAAFDRPGKPYGSRYEIFAHMAAQSPDLMLWLGDNVYLREVDYDSRWGMAERYRHTRALPALQPLLHSTHHYAIWDDHDYGPDNANRAFPLKEHSLELFRRYWANPAYGLPDTPGIFTSFTFGDIDFFLLDDRYHRNADNAPETATKGMLGTAQLAWLKDALLRSRAPFKIIANGSQMLNELAGPENWKHFRDERSGFLAWLGETGIPGVVFLSGDVHYSALFRKQRDQSYPLYELSCSPLTAGARKRDFPDGNPLLVPGTHVREQNYCQLDFSGPGDARLLTMSVVDADGNLKWSREIASSELRN